MRDQLNYDKGVEQGIQKGLEQGMQQGLEKGMRQGLEKGMQQGLEKGEAIFAQLAMALVQAGRADEVAKAASDGALRSKLYEEFGIRQ